MLVRGTFKTTQCQFLEFLQSDLTKWRVSIQGEWDGILQGGHLNYTNIRKGGLRAGWSTTSEIQAGSETTRAIRVRFDRANSFHSQGNKLGSADVPIYYSEIGFNGRSSGAH